MDDPLSILTGEGKGMIEVGLGLVSAGELWPGIALITLGTMLSLAAVYSICYCLKNKVPCPAHFEGG